MSKPLNKPTRTSLATMITLLADDCGASAVTVDDLNRSFLMGSTIYRVAVSCRPVPGCRSDNSNAEHK